MLLPTALRGVKLCLAFCCWLMFLATVVGALVLGLWISLLANSPDATVGEAPANDMVVPDGTPDRVLHFMHISDSHVSFNRPHWTAAFRRFLTHVPVVDPLFVVHSGDITHGFPYRTDLLPHGRMIESEWRMYREALEEAGLFDPEKWVDVRGNHDGMNVYDFTSEENLYRRYGVWGDAMYTDNPRAYSHVVRLPFGTYQILLMDLVPIPGISTPTNFLADGPEARGAVPDMVQRAGANMTVAVAHYPFKSIPRSNMPDLLAESGVPVMLCGHAHQSGMYAWHGDVLMLEVSDLRSDHEYRVFAIDNDMFSFTDAVMGQWPVVVITNPKDARTLSRTEPLYRIRASTHIRALVFAPEDEAITRVTAHIDGRMWCEMARVEGYHGLYACAWDPVQFAAGSHDIRVEAELASGDVGNDKHPFTVTGSAQNWSASAATLRAYFSWFTFFFIMNLLAWFFWIVIMLMGTWVLGFVAAAAVAPSVLLVPAFATWSAMLLAESQGMPPGSTSFPGEGPLSWPHRVWRAVTWQFRGLLARFAALPIWWRLLFLLYGLYLLAAPLMIGPFVAWRWGVAYSWGLTYPDGYIPGWDIGVFIIFPIVWFWLPLILLFVTLPAYTYASRGGGPARLLTQNGPLSLEGLVLVTLLVAGLTLISILAINAYGVVTYFLSPILFPTVLLTVIVIVLTCLHVGWTHPAPDAAMNV